MEYSCGIFDSDPKRQSISNSSVVQMDEITRFRVEQAQDAFVLWSILEECSLTAFR